MPGRSFQIGNNRARKLRGQDVLEIREKYLTGLYTYGSLSNEYGVSLNTIANVVKGHTWKRIAGYELADQERQPPERVARPATDQEISESLSKFTDRLAQAPSAPFVHAKPQEPTGEGLDRLQRELAKLSTDDELGKLETKGD